MLTVAVFYCLTMSESSQRKMYTLLPRHIQRGGKFDQCNVLLSSRVCGLSKNESVSDPLVSPLSYL